MADDRGNTVLSTGKPVAENDGTQVGPVGIIVMTLYLVLLSILLLYSLVQIWPAEGPAAEMPPSRLPVTIILWSFSLSAEIRLLLIVILAGALGGQIHALRSLFWYVGQRALKMSWLVKYILLPYVGAGMAVIFYFVIRAGFLSPQAGIQQISLWGFAALAGLVGLFTDQAALKLLRVAETIFAKLKPGKDAQPQKAAGEES